MRGRTIPLSLPRRFVGDLLHAAAGVPTVPVQRRVNLDRLRDARRALPDRPSWTALFTAAYARVAREFRELRRVHLAWPYPRLYEYPVSVAALAIEREYRGEAGVFVGKVKDPAARSVEELDAILKHFRTAPVEEVKDFARSLRVSALPRPLRRVLWGLALNSGRQRGNYLGTFGVSVYSALGAESLHPISPCTTTLTYGVIADSGETDLRVVYDHRVLDGATVARALTALDRQLTQVLPGELRANMATVAVPRVLTFPAIAKAS